MLYSVVMTLAHKESAEKQPKFEQNTRGLQSIGNFSLVPFKKHTLKTMPSPTQKGLKEPQPVLSGFIKRRTLFTTRTKTFSGGSYPSQNIDTASTTFRVLQPIQYLLHTPPRWFSTTPSLPSRMSTTASRNV
jgi:hypothetical protein